MQLSPLRRLTLPLLFAALPCLLAQAADAPNHVPADYAGKPVSGTPQAIPGTIQAESYDTVASGDAKGVTVGYGKLGKTAFRPNADSAGLAKFGGGHVLTTGEAEAQDQVYCGWTETGEWFAYTVQVKEPGTYIFGGKFAAAGKGALLSVTFSPEITSGPIEIPTTDGFQPGVEVYHVWKKSDNLKEIKIPAAGTYVMKVKIEKNAGMNLDYYTFTKKP